MISGLVRLGPIETRRRLDWRRWSRGIARRSGGVAAIALAFATVSLHPSPARAQSINCSSPNQLLVMPPQLVRSEIDGVGILRGTLTLTQERRRLDNGRLDSERSCTEALLRILRIGDVLRVGAGGVVDPSPGPTLRARVGDLIQLALVNEVDPARFSSGLDVDACMEVGQGGGVYPGNFDTPPNCLHASSTTNIHFHGTHTNPDATGDNVFLQVRPLPRNNQGVLTTTAAQATADFGQFYTDCTSQLRNNPLKPWPTQWSDLPPAYTGLQEVLLKAHQARYPDQDLWRKNEESTRSGAWPQYYIGAVPYCFALPAYTQMPPQGVAAWPPLPGSTSPIMGQAPGTHWYHAHKHGSTAINVMNGMTGAFIIEGQYDDDLNTAYGEYMLASGNNWNTRSQPILVLNQLGNNLSLLSGGAGSNTPTGTQLAFTVNGQTVPTVQMQPGEIQLWRIINTSHRSAAYFMAPENGLQWRQLAQDGVQFADGNYQASLNKPFYLAPANRVDLLVRAPRTDETITSDILFQDVMARARVMPTPSADSRYTKLGTPLMTVTVTGDPVQLDGDDAQMEFLSRAPTQPPFLTDITDQELAADNYITRTLIFHSKAPRQPEQHTINGIQFDNDEAVVGPVMLGAVEEWKIVNTTPGRVLTETRSPGPQSIDHPLHIHINPFQITEVFDPNEYLVDDNGQLEGHDVNGSWLPIPKYVFFQNDTVPGFGSRQCVLDGDDPNTWRPNPSCDSVRDSTNLAWWDVFAIPSGRAVRDDNGFVLNEEGMRWETGQTPKVVPGYFKMRSRFVDFAGAYVLHCHILIHEDRGMMYTVSVERVESLSATHD